MTTYSDYVGFLTGCLHALVVTDKEGRVLDAEEGVSTLVRHDQ